ncbi:MAG TPA: hypothetical protein VN914_05625 [Polyangia bacterium]|nr:hypothetical protein [Polyangia bacterium]
MKRVLPLAALMALLGAALGFSCGKYESCDPGQVLQYNVCFPGLIDGGGGGTAGGGAGGAGGATTCRPANFPDAGDMCPDKAAGFGEPCAANSDCRCGKDLCAIMPGQSCGFCTRSNCLPDPSICPTGWSCFDASAFQAGYSLCVNL